jgi:hypothetical protein
MGHLPRVCLAGLLAATACSDDDVKAVSDDTTGGVGGGDLPASSTGAVDATTSTTAGTASGDGVDVSSGEVEDGTTTEAEPATLPYAGDIRLVRMTANQAVQVELYADDLQVAPEDYNTRLVAGRRTLLRGFWSLHANFTPRPLIGRLVVDYPDGTQLVQDYSVTVDGDSNDGGASLQWLLEPDQVVDGMQYRARILEADAASASGEVSDPPPIAPLSGRGTITLHTVPLEMKVTLIPVLHQFEGCEQAPAPTPEDVDAMRRELEQNNAVQLATIEVGTPMAYTAPIGTSGQGFSPVLTALAQQREIDAPPPNVYYYGLLDPCDGYPPGLLGQAIGIPPAPTQELSQQRIATGRWNGSGAGAAETFVHEIGHTQGRRHVTCTGGEGGPETDYPHPGGRIGVWGFGIYDFELRTPSGGRDYMTYCSNEWVSDYGWEQTLDVIETLTSWDYADTPPAPEQLALFGALYSDGTETWWTGHGAVPPMVPDTGDRVRFGSADGDVSTRAWVYTRPDSDTRQVIAALPDDFEHIVDIEWSPAGGHARSVPRGTIRQLHVR